jgi:hypothetical protein
MRIVTLDAMGIWSAFEAKVSKTNALAIINEIS